MGALKRPRKKKTGFKLSGPLTEAKVQNLIAMSKCERHLMSVPNTGEIWQWESDVASITTAGLTHDFEVKISRSDWLAEIREREYGVHGESPKRKRHDTLSRAREIAEKIKKADGPFYEIERGDGQKVTRSLHRQPPNYFWVVAAEGIVRADELPGYAGLLEVAACDRRGYEIRKVKPAPRLHTLKLHSKQLTAIARGLSLRLWSVTRDPWLNRDKEGVDEGVE